MNVKLNLTPQFHWAFEMSLAGTGALAAPAVLRLAVPVSFWKRSLYVMFTGAFRGLIEFYLNGQLGLSLPWSGTNNSFGGISWQLHSGDISFSMASSATDPNPFENGLFFFRPAGGFQAKPFYIVGAYDEITIRPTIGGTAGTMAWFFGCKSETLI